MRACLIGLVLVACSAEDPDDRPAELGYLIPALFQPSCATSMCHSRSAQAKDLVLEGSPDLVRFALVSKGFVYPGQPAGSPLLHFLRGDKVVLRMPPDAAWPDADIALVERWIRLGAPL
jgi:hypothetical protein